ASGTATVGTDTGAGLEYWNGSAWVAVAGNVTIAAGSTSVQLRTTVTDDSLYESAENFTLTATRVSGTTTNASATGTGTINDNDTAPTFAINDVSVSEGGVATFTVTRTGDAQQAQTVNYYSSGLTATQGTDYTGVSGTLTFNQGETTKTIQVQTTQDSTYEGPETFNIVLHNPNFGGITDNTGIGTILDDGTGPGPNPDDDTPTLSVSSPTVTENDTHGYVQFTVSLSNPSTQTTTVSLALNDGTAQGAGVDYGSAGPGNLLVSTDGGTTWSDATSATIPAGQTSLLVRSPINNDSIDEPNETFTLTATRTAGTPVTNPGGAASGTSTIIDDDAAPTIQSITPANSSVTEGSSLSFAVTLSNTSSSATTHNFSLGGGTATGGIDYKLPLANGDFDQGVTINGAGNQITVPAGVTTFHVSIPTYTDVLVEGAETATLTIGVQSAIGTINDGITPLVLDLNGDGVQTIGLESGVTFDVNADAVADRVGWVSPQDGLLARDINGDGIINDGSELFGSGTSDGQGGRTSDGFEALSLLDSNSDGVIDSNDAAWAELKVWQDRDTDGVTDAGELVSLESVGVQSLNLAYATSDYSENGNLHGLVGTYTATDGQTHEMTDVFFATGDAVASEADTASNDNVPILTEVVVGLAAAALVAVDAVAEDVAASTGSDAVPVLTDVVVLDAEAEAEAEGDALTAAALDEQPASNDPEALPEPDMARVDTDLVLVMDTSASMDQVINNSMETRLDRAIEAAQGLIDGFGVAGDVNVKIIAFNSSAQIVTGADWADAATASELLAGLHAGADDARDYEIALEQVMTIDSYPAAVNGQSVLYFFSDGGPTAGDLAGNAATWQAYRSANLDQVQAIGLGGTADILGSLHQISANAHVIPDLDQLNSFVFDSITDPQGVAVGMPNSADRALSAASFDDPALAGAQHAFTWDKAGIAALDDSGSPAWADVNWSLSLDGETLTAVRNGVNLLTIDMTDLNEGGVFVVSQHVPLMDVSSLSIPYAFSDGDQDAATGSIYLEVRETMVTNSPLADGTSPQGMDTLLGANGADVLIYDATDAAARGGEAWSSLFLESTVDLSALAIPVLESIEALHLATNVDIPQITLGDLIDIADEHINSLFINGDGNNEVTINTNYQGAELTPQASSDHAGYTQFSGIDATTGHGYSLYVEQDINLQSMTTP
ncbi:MAG: VWA domain-containing protein, partial [Gammaproteobacteria bacterium]|nr:VWA domain-containing protein [Gammaproteobacteria bacterium]MBU1654164.1 VWA domain-containing protein [Gammaproteobacteria bacterium]MBU1960205.1 VWA domain-containing protein [Gammaproteobacteria bacterium]